MPNNKVIFGNQTLIDLTADTVNAANLISGYTAHDRSGAQITGSHAPVVYTGTVNTTTINTEHEIDTGFGSNLTCFIMQGYATNSYGTGIQEFIKWESSFGNNFYFAGAYSGGGVSAYSAFTSTSNARGAVIVSITDGVVTIKSAANSNWSNIAFTWYAFGTVSAITLVTPNDTTPPTILNNQIIKANGDGYLRSTAHSSLDAGTALYTNSSLTSNYTSGTITLSPSIETFDFIQIECVVGTGSTTSRCFSGLFPLETWRSMVSSNYRYAVVNYTNSDYRYDRMFYYMSDTKVGVTTCQRHNASNTSAQSAYMIPSKVYGYKLI